MTQDSQTEYIHNDFKVDYETTQVPKMVPWWCPKPNSRKQMFLFTEFGQIVDIKRKNSVFMQKCYCTKVSNESHAMWVTWNKYLDIMIAKTQNMNASVE